MLTLCWVKWRERRGRLLDQPRGMYNAWQRWNVHAKASQLDIGLLVCSLRRVTVICHQYCVTN